MMYNSNNMKLLGWYSFVMVAFLVLSLIGYIFDSAYPGDYVVATIIYSPVLYYVYKSLELKDR